VDERTAEQHGLRVESHDTGCGHQASSWWAFPDGLKSPFVLRRLIIQPLFVSIELHPSQPLDVISRALLPAVVTKQQSLFLQLSSLGGLGLSGAGLGGNGSGNVGKGWGILIK